MQGNLFTASVTGLSPQLRTENRLALILKPTSWKAKNRGNLSYNSNTTPSLE